MRWFLAWPCFALLVVTACGSSDSTPAAGAGGAAPTSLRQADGSCNPVGEWQFALEAGGLYPQCDDARFFLSGVSIAQNADGSLRVDPGPYLVATNPPNDTEVNFAADHCSLEIQITTTEDPTQPDSPTVGVDVTLDLSVTPSTGNYGFEAPADCGDDQDFHLEIARQ